MIKPINVFLLVFSFLIYSCVEKNDGFNTQHNSNTATLSEPFIYNNDTIKIPIELYKGEYHGGYTLELNEDSTYLLTGTFHLGQYPPDTKNNIHHFSSNGKYHIQNQTLELIPSEKDQEKMFLRQPFRILNIDSFTFLIQNKFGQPFTSEEEFNISLVNNINRDYLGVPNSFKDMSASHSISKDDLIKKIDPKYHYLLTPQIEIKILSIDSFPAKRISRLYSEKYYFTIDKGKKDGMIAGLNIFPHKSRSLDLEMESCFKGTAFKIDEVFENKSTVLIPSLITNSGCDLSNFKFFTNTKALSE